jgi:hypothetical protein
MEVEDGGEEVSRLDCGRSCVRSYLVEGEDAEAAKAGGKGDDLGVGWKGARRGAENESQV